MTMHTRILALALTTSAAACASESPVAGGDESGGVVPAPSTSEPMASTGASTTGAGKTTTDATTLEPPADTTASASTGGPTSTGAGAEESTGSSSAASTTQAASSSTTGSDVVPCDIADAVLPPITPNVMLVLDKSGSMLTQQDDGDPMTVDPTRWNALYDVVSFIVTGFEDRVAFGVELFPDEGAIDMGPMLACMMNGTPEVGLALGNAGTILATIPPADSLAIQGGTPATAAITVAQDALLTADPAQPRAIVFVTDGLANCSADALLGLEPPTSYDEQLPVVVGAGWTDLGIPTYVVGIAIDDAIGSNGVNPHDELETVAIAGGVPTGGAPQFYEANTEDQLADALDAIIYDALSCTVALTPVPAYPDLLQVVIDGASVPAVADCAAEDGWVYLSNYDTIALCGSWCAAFKDAGALTANYFCTAG